MPEQEREPACGGHGGEPTGRGEQGTDSSVLLSRSRDAQIKTRFLSVGQRNRISRNVALPAPIEKPNLNEQISVFLPFRPNPRQLHGSISNILIFASVTDDILTEHPRYARQKANV